MKKMISLILCLALVCCLFAGCAAKTADDTTTPADTSADTAQTETPAAETETPAADSESDESGIEYNGKLKKLRPLIDMLRELGKKYGVAPAQISVAWAVSKGTVPIVGLTKPKYAEELAGGAVLKLADDEISQLERLADSFGIVSKGVWEPKVERK